jgi:thiamine monophosphate synthase
LQTGAAAVAAGLIAGTSKLAAESPKGAQAPGKPAPAATGAMDMVQVPTMKFGGVDISRMVLGVNPLYGYAHYNLNFASSMAEWYTTDKVVEVMKRAQCYGINAFNYVTTKRSLADLAQFQADGGKMHLIAQVAAKDDVAQLVKDIKPLAVHRQGEVVDIAFRERNMGSVREWCKQVRDLGVIVGVGTHKPEVIDLVESQGWDVDFYAGCVYNRSRTPEEIKQILNGEIIEMPKEFYLQSDPPRMYKVMRQTSKPCFAFKILAAGRIPPDGIEGAFRTAFQSIKPIDGVFVGMYPRMKDEVKENAEIVHKLLTES